MDRTMDEILSRPGLVMYTLVNREIRDVLEGRCMERNVPTISVLDPVIRQMGAFLGIEAQRLPGRQHAMDAAYFRRIDAMQFTLAHDDGHLTEDLDEADIVLVGVSRTSKTPTSMYLANRGYRVANIPIVPGIALPDRLFDLKKAFVVGLTTQPDRLIKVRRSRLLSHREERTSAYVDLEEVQQEVLIARRLCARHDWPVIDVTRRSIEETAAAILNQLAKRRPDIVDAI